jgi:RNA polymerase sigma-70 factor (sigma-E family)
VRPVSPVTLTPAATRSTVAASCGEARDFSAWCKWIGGLVRIQGVRREQAEFVAFYESSRDTCLRAVTATTGDRQVAEDLVAEAFARAWTSWRTVSRHPAPEAWVVRTALNAGVSRWRRHEREVPLLHHDSAALNGPSEVDTTVVAALRRLPTRQREVVVLRVLLDLDTATTAKVLKIAPGTVMSHLSRGVAALRCDLPSPISQTTSEAPR